MMRHRTSPGEAPLRAWGTTLRALAGRRRHRIRTIAVMVGAGALCVAPVMLSPRPRLVWNASASAPIGLYAVVLTPHIGRGDWVIAQAPLAVRALADRRHYLPLHVPLVKRVAAIPGDVICGLGDLIVRDGVPLARRRPTDAAGRALPWWSGCVRLDDRHYLLVTTAVRDSFDGRYFGPSETHDIIGRGVLLWPR